MRRWGWARAEAIPLFHPRVTQYAEHHTDFDTGESDLFSMERGAYTVVRAMSVVFNWPDPERRRAIVELASALEQGGLLVIGQGGGPYPLRCSIFRRCGTRMELMEHVGLPARELELVEQVRLQELPAAS